jgi:hypothetical protein
MSQPCSTCKGQKWIQVGNGPWTCPTCEGTGVQWDPGREFTYAMGPFQLNAYASANPTNAQYFSGAASTNAQLQGVTCQVANRPFRWMFALKQNTFPFTVQLSDAGSGSGRTFVPVATQVHSDLLFGDAKNPMPLPTPYVFKEQVNITGNFTDLIGATGFAGVTNGSAAVTWVSGGLFNTTQAFGAPYPGSPYWNGATIIIGGVSYVILAVTSQNTLTLATTYQGGSNANIAYAVPNTIWVGFKGVELSARSTQNQQAAPEGTIA